MKYKLAYIAYGKSLFTFQDISNQVINMRRYIGITGFKTVDEVYFCDSVASRKEPMLMYGVLTSQKSLKDPELEGSRRPAMIAVPELLAAVPDYALPMIHHCSDNRKIAEELSRILSYEDIYDRGLVKAVQLNQRLPDISELEKVKNRYTGLQIVLQLEPPDLIDPKGTGRMVKNYEGLIEYVIIDPSRGAGKKLSLNNTLEVLLALETKAMPVIAGGLRPYNVAETIRFFRAKYGDDFCIDAEGGLREDENCLSRKLAGGYIQEAMMAYKD